MFQSRQAGEGIRIQTAEFVIRIAESVFQCGQPGKGIVASMLVRSLLSQIEYLPARISPEKMLASRLPRSLLSQIEFFQRGQPGKDARVQAAEVVAVPD